ncbi:UNVERIFIED_CONTAM: hypothetical protein K2H54_050283 [Gekko kuhli]
MVPQEQLAKPVHLAHPDLQDFPELQVLRVKLALGVPLDPLVHQDREENLGLKANPVVPALQVLEDVTEAQERKVYRVLLVCLVLRDCLELVALLVPLVLMETLDKEVHLVSPVRMVAKENQEQEASVVLQVSAVLLVEMELQVKRVPLVSEVALAVRDQEEVLVNPDVMDLQGFQE